MRVIPPCPPVADPMSKLRPVRGAAYFLLPNYRNRGLNLLRVDVQVRRFAQAVVHSASGNNDDPLSSFPQKLCEPREVAVPREQAEGVVRVHFANGVERNLDIKIALRQLDVEAAIAVGASLCGRPTHRLPPPPARRPH